MRHESKFEACDQGCKKPEKTRLPNTINMPLQLKNQHPWEVSPQEAREIQEALRAQIRVQPMAEGQITRVGGMDASFGPESICAAAVVLDYATQELIEQATAQLPLSFPYIPGLLSFREAPAVLEALGKLSALPEVLIVDGHGYAHPRRFGLACHLGVLLDLPTIGCAKSVLVGEYASLSETAGSSAELWDKGEIIGLAVRTREKVKPVYVSIGHKVDLDSAQRIVLDCTRGYRLPEPSRLAHQFAAQAK
jgi:deoxyribonuclease V